MLQPKPEIRNFRSTQQSFGEKLISILRYPLFTIPLSFPVKKKPVSQGKEKKEKSKKSVKHKRFVPKERTEKPVLTRSVSTGKKVTTHIFSKNRNKEEYEKILFILRACDKNGGRAFTNVLHVERLKNTSRLIGTDGKRMHITEIKTHIKPGDYKPIVTKDTVTLCAPVSKINFPNWERVVPTNVVRCGCINLENASIGVNSNVNSSFTRMTGEKVNPSFLSDLTKKTWVVYSQNEKRKALLLKELGAENETYAVMMPLV